MIAILYFKHQYEKLPTPLLDVEAENTRTLPLPPFFRMMH